MSSSNTGSCFMLVSPKSTYPKVCVNGKRNAYSQFRIKDIFKISTQVTQTLPSRYDQLELLFHILCESLTFLISSTYLSGEVLFIVTSALMFVFFTVPVLHQEHSGMKLRISLKSKHIPPSPSPKRERERERTQ